MESLEPIYKAVLEGDAAAAKSGVAGALKAGVPADRIMNEGLVGAMTEVGRLFEAGEYFVPEMLIAARAMKEAMNVLEPRLIAAGITPKFTAVIGTVQGDLHDIGKNLVAVMWKGANFKVVDLGTNVAPAKFVSAIREHRPQLVGLSALLTTTMPAMVETVRAIRSSGCPPTKVMVGGAPISQQFADEIGADGYAPDAASAADKAKTLVGAV